VSQFYEDMAGMANEMIAEFGQAVTLSVTTPGRYDTKTGRSWGPTTSTTHCRGIDRAYKADEIDDTLVKRGDKRLIVSPRDASGAALDQPTANGRATLADGSSWTIMAVEPIRPGGSAIIYIVQLRN